MRAVLQGALLATALLLCVSAGKASQATALQP